ncbi:MAG: four helix bundle protein [bacterium]|nr:four helix bundle protein [bacterium]
MASKNYKEWEIWKKAMELVEDIYGITKKFPREEEFGLVSQMRRAAISIPSNLAEGHARINKKDRHHFFVISFASSKELETQLEISRRLHYVSEEVFNKSEIVLQEVIRRLSNFVFENNRKPAP